MQHAQRSQLRELDGALSAQRVELHLADVAISRNLPQSPAISRNLPRSQLHLGDVAPEPDHRAVVFTVTVLALLDE